MSIFRQFAACQLHRSRHLIQLESFKYLEALPPTNHVFSPSAATMTDIKLISGDGKIFDVTKEVGNMFETIKNAVYTLSDDNTEAIPLTKVNGTILELAIKWAEDHKNDPMDIEEPIAAPLSQETKDWLATIELDSLFDLVNASNYLESRRLFRAVCKYMANLMLDMKPEEMRALFNCDYIPTKEDIEREQKEEAAKEKAAKVDAAKVKAAKTDKIK